MGPVKGDHRCVLDIAIVDQELVPLPEDWGDSLDASRDRKSCKERSCDLGEMQRRGNCDREWFCLWHLSDGNNLGLPHSLHDCSYDAVSMMLSDLNEF